MEIIAARQNYQSALLLEDSNAIYRNDQNPMDIKDIYESLSKLDLLYKVGKAVGEETELWKILDHTMHLTAETLKASDSSILLVDEETGKLFFEKATGNGGKILSQKKQRTTSDIASWVVKHGQPLIVNDIAKDTRFNRTACRTAIHSFLCVPLIVGRRITGVLEVLNKQDGKEFTNRDMELLIALSSTAALAIDNAKLHHLIASGYLNTIKVLSASIDAKDPYTYGHSQRVTEYALLGANSLQLTSKELRTIQYAGVLHDIGKISINETILRKPSSLTSEEWAIIRTHPSVGADILSDVAFLEEARTLVLNHHEKHDGTGYPDGKTDEEIPIGARLISVADAFDTMTTERSYRPAISKDRAINELQNCTGTQFCPVAVEAFISSLQKPKNQ